MTPTWQRVADGVHVWRYPVLDVTVTAVSGAGATLVVDTLSSARQAAQLAAALDELPAGRLTVVNTHAHFDHWFGNGTLLDRAGTHVDVWAHADTCRRLAGDPDVLVAAAAAECPELAAELAGTPLVPPYRPVTGEVTLDIGGRPVRLLHPGRGHTAGDLAVLVPDVGVLVAGDLVEQGAPPQFSDAYPVSWPAALDRLVPLATGPVVPGHGAVVDVAYLRAQRAELAELAETIRAGYAAGAPVEAVADTGPYDRETRLTAATRGYRELAATPPQ